MIRKIFALMLVTAMLMTCALAVTPDAEKTTLRIIRGDVDYNNEVDIVDIALMRSHIVGVNTLSGEDFEFADVNLDSKVDVLDVTITRFSIARGYVTYNPDLDTWEERNVRTTECLQNLIGDKAKDYMGGAENKGIAFEVYYTKYIDGVETTDTIYMSFDITGKLWHVGCRNIGAFDNLEIPDSETIKEKANAFIQENGGDDCSYDSVDGYSFDVMPWTGELVVYTGTIGYFHNIAPPPAVGGMFWVDVAIVGDEVMWRDDYEELCRNAPIDEERIAKIVDSFIAENDSVTAFEIENLSIKKDIIEGWMIQVEGYASYENSEEKELRKIDIISDKAIWSDEYGKIFYGFTRSNGC